MTQEALVNVNLTYENKITPYDEIVESNIYSLFLAGNDTFTPATVCRTINGLTESETPSKIQEAEITDSIEKLRKTNIKIEADFSNYMGIEYKISIDDMILSVTRTEKDGFTVYKFNDNAPPRISQYSNKNKRR